MKHDLATLLKGSDGQVVNFSDSQEEISAEYQIIADGKAKYLNCVPLYVKSDIPAGQEATQTVAAKVIGLGNGRAVIVGI